MYNLTSNSKGFMNRFIGKYTQGEGNRMHSIKSTTIEKILALLVCTSIVLIISSQLHVGFGNPPAQVSELFDGWYYMEDGQKTYVSLPASIHLDSEENLVLYCDSLTKEQANQMLTTRGAVYRLNVSAGDKILYQYDDAAFPRNTQMASKVNCTALLSPSFDGETIAFTYENTQNGDFHIQKVYIGEPLAVFFYHCSMDAATLLSIFVMAILAVITVCISIYLKYMHVQEKRFADIAYFLLFCSCWFLTDSSLFQMLGGSSPVIRYISFYAFMMLAVPMLHFIKNTEGLKHYRIIDVIIFLFYGNVILQSLLNYLGLFDFVDMLFLTHLLLFGGIAVLIPLLIHTYKKSGGKELYSILISFAVVAGGGVTSLIFYWLLEISYYEIFFELGIVVFIILLIRMLVMAMVENLRYKTEAMVYQRLAREDSMTGLKNRRAFDELMEKVQENINSYHSLFLVFMDVNQLKYINDTQGHHTGDELIIAAARCIEKTYGSMGTCYRIGGDEFCAVLPNIILSEQQLSAQLDEELRLYNNICSKYQISLSRGISNIRDENGNLKTVSDWKKEADLKMYQDKGWIRHEE